MSAPARRRSNSLWRARGQALLAAWALIALVLLGGRADRATAQSEGTGEVIQGMTAAAQYQLMAVWAQGREAGTLDFQQDDRQPAYLFAQEWELDAVPSAVSPEPTGRVLTSDEVVLLGGVPPQDVWLFTGNGPMRCEVGAAELRRPPSIYFESWALVYALVCPPSSSPVAPIAIVNQASVPPLRWMQAESRVVPVTPELLAADPALAALVEGARTEQQDWQARVDAGTATRSELAAFTGVTTALETFQVIGVSVFDYVGNPSDLTCEGWGDSYAETNDLVLGLRSGAAWHPLPEHTFFLSGALVWGDHIWLAINQEGFGMAVWRRLDETRFEVIPVATHEDDCEGWCSDSPAYYQEPYCGP